MHIFDGTTADEVWLKAAAAFRESPEVRVQSSRAGETQELLGVVFTIANPRQRWIVSREPAINPAFALAEVVWILAGRRDAAFLNYWNPKLPQFAGSGSKYHGAYGHRLRKHFGLDQLNRAYHALRNNPDSRQVVLQIWDARRDFPLEDGAVANSDIPCNVCSFAKIRDGRLEWTQVLRSNDLFLGVPHNFVQFTSLQEILAGWLGVEVGHYRHLADCLHIYRRDRGYIESPNQITHETNSDVLRFNKQDSEMFFAELARRLDKMTGASLAEKSLRQLATPQDLPRALRNWLLVVAADCARRRGWINLTYDLMFECSNPLLRHLWDRWFARWRSICRQGSRSDEATTFLQPFLPLRLA
jgi:thymidylate synthase